MNRRPSLRTLLLTSVSLACLGGTAGAQAEAGSLPHFIQKDGRHAFIVDGAPFLMLAGQCNNSSAWPDTLPGVWDAIAPACQHARGPRLLGAIRT